MSSLKNTIIIDKFWNWTKHDTCFWKKHFMENLKHIHSHNLHFLEQDGFKQWTISIWIWILWTNINYLLKNKNKIYNSFYNDNNKFVEWLVSTMDNQYSPYLLIFTGFSVSYFILKTLVPWKLFVFLKNYTFELNFITYCFNLNIFYGWVEYIDK